MIRVEPQPEPEDFGRRVRQPGRRALAQGKKPLPDHWVHCLENLWRAYLGVCAYACFRIPRVTGGRSVDHFSAKSRQPELAYEWTNYRLNLNAADCRLERADYLEWYQRGEWPFEQLQRWYPFAAKEMERQGLAPPVES